MLALDPRVIIAAIEQDMGEGIRRELRLNIQQCIFPSRWTEHWHSVVELMCSTKSASQTQSASEGSLGNLCIVWLPRCGVDEIRHPIDSLYTSTFQETASNFTTNVWLVAWSIIGSG